MEKFDDRFLAGETDSIGAEFIDLYPCHMIAAHVARELGLAGVCTMIPTACAAGNYAIASFQALPLSLVEQRWIFVAFFLAFEASGLAGSEHAI